jgi:SAM-dependent methyltransferase
MSVTDRIRSWLYEPRVRGVDVDDNNLLDMHAAVLRDKRLLRSTFETFYQDMASLCDRYLPVNGIEIELGTGAGFFKMSRPGLVTSDVRTATNIDLILDAQQMALADSTVRCIYAINVFHHLPQPEKFLDELTRVLRPGGGCVLIEPHGGPASAALHRRLHTDEHFDRDQPEWTTPEIRGPMSGANQALSHIVFVRDRALFQQRYGKSLEIAYHGYSLNHLRYLFSGGLNFRQLLPSATDPLLRAVEAMCKPFARYITLHHVIVLRRL